jgi:serine/threonine protein kinase
MTQIENGKTYVAVKQFKLKTNRGYLERWNLNVRKLRDLNHPHLIRHRVTCEFDDAYYAVFPLADGGDLLQYWKLSKRTLSTPELALWMLRQMLGLIDALAALHDRKLRHSNLNPANILVFNSATDPILVIGDVGGYLQDSSQISLQNSFRATMPSYEAPEAYVNSQSSLSRKVDLWSLGCIFLEFTIWCLWDYDAVTAVRDRRVAPDMHSYFFSNDRVNVHPEAISSMSSLLRDSRVGPDTALSRLVVLIQDDLLQVDENRRPKADKVVAKLKSVVKKIVANELLACKNDANPSSKPEILLTQDKQLMDYSSKASLS